MLCRPKIYIEDIKKKKHLLMIECILMLDIDQVSLLKQHSSVLEVDLIPVTDNPLAHHYPVLLSTYLAIHDAE